jgi:hexosaminidase
LLSHEPLLCLRSLSPQRGAGVAPDNLLHLGGDEVDTSCWTSTPAIAQWLKDKKLTADQGYEYFVRRAQAIARGQGRDVVGWEEIWKHFGTKLDKSTIIHQVCSEHLSWAARYIAHI